MRLLWWLGTVVAISLISIFLSHNHRLDPVQNLSLTVTSPVQGGLRDLAGDMDDRVAGFIDGGDLRRENERLRAENAQLKAQIAEQQDLVQRIEELEAALEVKQGRPEDRLLVANIIAQDPSGLKRQVAINRGTDDGIDEGMAVLSEDNTLIGTVSRAYADFAWIRLITDPDSVVNAQVNIAGLQPGEGEQPEVITGAPGSPTPTPGADVNQDPSATPAPQPFVRGVAEGDLRSGIMLELPPDSDVKEGDLVVTSGLGGNYPSAVLIGTIQSVSSTPQSPFTSTTLEPAVDLSTLHTVLVLVSFTPARLEGP